MFFFFFVCLEFSFKFVQANSFILFFHTDIIEKPSFLCTQCLLNHLKHKLASITWPKFTVEHLLFQAFLWLSHTLSFMNFSLIL